MTRSKIFNSGDVDVSVFGYLPVLRPSGTNAASEP